MYLSPQLMDLARRGAELQLRAIDAEVAHLRAAFPGLPALHQNGNGRPHKTARAVPPSPPTDPTPPSPSAHRSIWTPARRRRQGRMMRAAWRRRRLAETSQL